MTTNGSRAVAATAVPAARDAACLAGVRAAGARIVGKTNLHELCFGITGINPVFGTPVNPLDPGLLPGGSSSGSAVVVATGEADIALGTDTGGSVRIPAACCGVVGLKTTHGRIPLDGVAPLAPSFDTVGVLAPTVAGAVDGMALLEPGFSAAVDPAHVVGRVRPVDEPVEPDFDEAVDAALRKAGFEVVELPVAGWTVARNAQATLLLAEAWRSLGHLLSIHEGVAEPVRSRVVAASLVTEEQVAHAREVRQQWIAEMRSHLGAARVVALPTLLRPPGRVDDPEPAVDNALCAPINLGGVPALSIPLPGRPGTAIQLVGTPGAEEQLCATGLLVERYR